MKHKKNTIVYESYTSDIEQKSTELLNEIIETEQELAQACMTNFLHVGKT